MEGVEENKGEARAKDDAPESEPVVQRFVPLKETKYAQLLADRLALPLVISETEQKEKEKAKATNAENILVDGNASPPTEGATAQSAGESVAKEAKDTDIKQLEDDSMPVLHGPLGQRSPAVDELGPRDGAVAAAVESIEQQPRELPDKLNRISVELMSN